VRKARNPEKTISFKEKITGETVTLQSPSVEKIGRSEYKAEVSTIKAEAGM
jgi:hypothetical protein